jgi:hypothetical protein
MSLPSLIPPHQEGKPANKNEEQEKGVVVSERNIGR